MPSRRMRGRFLRELEKERLGDVPRLVPEVSPADIEALPEPVRRCLAFAGAVGQPHVWSIRAHAMGRARLAPARPWMHCEAWNYATASPVSRMFQQRLRYGQVVPMLLRDQYVEGRGRNFGRSFDAMRVVDASDENIALGELSQYVADALMLAPGLLLGPATTWSSVDDGAFDVEMRDHGWTLRAHACVDARGAVTEVSSLDRLYGMPAESEGAPRGARRNVKPAATWVRTRWSVRATAWAANDERRFARRMEWHWSLENADFDYAELQIDGLEFNVSPRDEVRPSEIRDV